MKKYHKMNYQNRSLEGQCRLHKGGPEYIIKRMERVCHIWEGQSMSNKERAREDHIREGYSRSHKGRTD